MGIPREQHAENLARWSSDADEIVSLVHRRALDERRPRRPVRDDGAGFLKVTSISLNIS
jgi:hypothetical protein